MGKQIGSEELIRDVFTGRNTARAVSSPALQVMLFSWAPGSATAPPPSARATAQGWLRHRDGHRSSGNSTSLFRLRKNAGMAGPDPLARGFQDQSPPTVQQIRPLVVQIRPCDAGAATHSNAVGAVCPATTEAPVHKQIIVRALPPEAGRFDRFVIGQRVRWVKRARRVCPWTDQAEST